jgi:hypothetical protein
MHAVGPGTLFAIPWIGRAEQRNLAHSKELM